MRLKIFITVTVLFCLWWLIQVPRVANALFLFLALGVNPFTNRDIAPGTMAQILGGVLVVTILALFMSDFRRFGRWLRAGRNSRQHAPQPQAAVPTSQSPVFAPVPVAPMPALVGTQLPVVQEGLELAPLPALTPAAMTPPLARLEQIRHAAPPPPQGHMQQFPQPVRSARTSIFTKVRAQVAHGLHNTGVWTVTRIRRAWFASGVGALIAAQACRDGWRWLRPHLERFDKWLEQQVHQSDTGIKLARAGSELEKTLRALTLKDFLAVRSVYRALRK